MGITQPVLSCHLPQGVLESRFLAFLAGAAVYSSGNLLLFFSADAT